MDYKITLYDNFDLPSIHKSGIEHVDNQISNSFYRLEVDLLDDVNILNKYIYSCGFFINKNTLNRNNCISNIITFDINNDNYFKYKYDDLIEYLFNKDYKFLLYQTTNEGNYRLLILLDRQIMSDEYKILWEQYCIELDLVQWVNTNIKDISRKWFATKNYILGNY